MAAIKTTVDFWKTANPATWKELDISVRNTISSGYRWILSLAEDKAQQTDPIYLHFAQNLDRLKSNTTHWVSSKKNAAPGNFRTEIINENMLLVQMMAKGYGNKVFTKSLATGFRTLVAEMKNHSNSCLHVSKAYLIEIPELESILREEVFDKGISVFIYTGDSFVQTAVKLKSVTDKDLGPKPLF
jgi:hypothetical protein